MFAGKWPKEIRMKRREFFVSAAAGAVLGGSVVGSGPALRKSWEAAIGEPQLAPAPAHPHLAGALRRPDDGGSTPEAAARPRQSFAQQGEDLILYNLLRHELGLSRPTYIDIGAADRVRSNNTYLLYCTGSRGVLVEPNPTYVALLRMHRPEDLVVAAGVGIGDARAADYYVIRGRPSLNTFSPDAVARLRALEGREVVERVMKMPLIAVNRLIASVFGREPDLISIDVEGLDLAILETLDFARFRPAVICAETTHPGVPHERTPIAQVLAARGYLPCAGTLFNTIFVDRRRLAPPPTAT
jgi:FkbM family methyltransferase